MLKSRRGFTIVELLIVIVIIGILAGLVIVAYNGVARAAIDASVKADTQNLNTSLGLYAATNSDQYVSWFSGNAQPSGLNAKLSPGNYADIVTSSDSKQYCIRVFNLSSTYSSATAAYTAEQPAGACATLTASDDALAAGPSPTSGWLAIYNNCGVRYDGKGYCWGSGASGALGNGTSTDSASPVAITMSGVLAGKTLKSIVPGCAIASDNNAYCWGDNYYGSLGNGTNTNSSVPVAVNTSGVLAGKTIKSISSGGGTVCVIASDNKGYCWGSNSSGVLGNGNTTDQNVPVAVYASGVLAGKTLLSISVGNSDACAIASDNNAYCWGTDNRGGLGDNGSNYSAIPVAVSQSGVLAGKTITSIAANFKSGCAIASDGKAYCWGAGFYGELGNGGTVDSGYPTAVDTSGVLAGKTLKSIVASTWGYCALSTDGNVYCWGVMPADGLATDNNYQSTYPVAVLKTGMLGNKQVKTLSSTCAIATDNTAYCWNAVGLTTTIYFGNSSMYVGDGFGNNYANQPVLIPQP